MNTNFKPIINAVNEHFALPKKHSDFQLPTPDDYDDEFMLFNKPIEIVTREVAIDNANSYFNENREYHGDFNMIGLYRRLDKTNYYFRWL